MHFGAVCHRRAAADHRPAAVLAAVAVACEHELSQIPLVFGLQIACVARLPFLISPPVPCLPRRQPIVVQLFVAVPDRVRQIIEEQCSDLGYALYLYNLERIRDRVHVRDPILMVNHGDDLVEVV